ALHTSQSTPATLPLPPRWSLLCPNGPASCSWHRLPCPSGNPPDHALPANHGNSRPVAPFRQSATYAPCVGSVARASAAVSPCLPPAPAHDCSWLSSSTRPPVAGGLSLRGHS